MRETTSLHPTVSTVSSVEAYVLPEVVLVAPTIGGVVTRMFVGEREAVARGQDLLEVACSLEQFQFVRDVPAPPSAARGNGDALPRDTGQRITVKASFSGVVSRCFVEVGDSVSRSKPALSVIRAEDVLVVARFRASAMASIPNALTASVRIPRARVTGLPATILGMGGILPWHASDTAPGEDGTVRVIARLRSLPVHALWPGIEAVVDLSCTVEEGA